MQKPTSETVSTTPAPLAPAKKRRFSFDPASRALLARFCRDWVSPRWRELLVALVLTGVLAATTGAYPMIIKPSFDTLMNRSNQATLPLVLGAIIGVTMLRSLFLYLQTVETNRIVMRMTTDMQEAAFAHLIGRRSRPPHARDAGPARVAADQRHLASCSRRLRPRSTPPSATCCPIVAARRIDVLSRLGDVADRAGRLPDRGAADRGDRPAPAPRRQAHAERARRHDLAVDREAVRRAPDQGVPARRAMPPSGSTRASSRSTSCA